MVDIRYIGHSAFEIKLKNNSIMIDPFVSINQNYDYKEIENLTDIFLTHGHGDHLGEALEISKDKDATITAIFELAKYCESQGCKTRDVGMGGWINYDWGRVIFLPAFHSSSLPNGGYAGHAASILFDAEGVRIYHAGDTCLNSEMKLVKELYRPNIALLPIGGTYTMDVEHAAIAAQWIGAQTVIPMHYGTFPTIQADIQKFAQLIQMQNTNFCILNPNEIKQ